MSINLIARSVENTLAVASTPTIGFSTAGATVLGLSSVPTDVIASTPSLSLSVLDHAVNNEIRVIQNATVSLDLSPQNAVVSGIPEQSNLVVTASSASLPLSANNALVNVSGVDDFPRLGQLRYGARTYAENNAIGVAERQRMASCHVVYIGLFNGGGWDTGNSNFLSRAEIVDELHLLNPDLVIYDYIIVMESTDGGSFGAKLSSETGPTGNGGTWTPNDWWARNTSGDRISSFANNFNTNITNFITLDSQGRDFVDNYFEARNLSHVIPHGVTGPAGINLFIDNVFYKSRLNNKDLNRDGVSDGGRSNPQAPEEKAWRAGTRKLADLFRATHPNILITVNNTDWWDEQSPPVAMQEEYIGIGDGGVTEQMTTKESESSFPFSRVYSDSTINSTNFGSWQLAQDAYIYGVENTVGLKHQSYVAIVDIDDVENIGSGTNFPLYRWTHASACMENGYYHVTDNNGYSSTPQFDEMGTINQGITGLSKGWLKQPIDPPARSDFFGTSRARRFQGGMVAVNTDLFNPVTIPVVEGGSWDNGEIPSGDYFEIKGSQSSTNAGRLVDIVNFPSGYTIDEKDGRFFRPALTPESWERRSTAAGVIWAHDFSESDNELRYFTRNGQSTSNPDISALSAPLTLTSTPFGSAKAIVSKGYGATLVSSVPAAAFQNEVQVWTVTDASGLPDPSPNSYAARIGNGSNNIEEVVITSINYVTNQVTLERMTTSNNTGENGAAHPAGYTVGLQGQGHWVRPFAAFPSGQNGQTTADIGISNGVVTKARTWNTTQGNNTHDQFREGYIGHRDYWADGPQTYKDWTPTTPTFNSTRVDAWDGDEIYIQFRAKISASRFDNPISKMLFVQNTSVSGSGQFFWQTGPQRYDEVLPAPDPSITYGQFLVGLTSFNDNASAAGGFLKSNGHNFGADTGNNSLQLSSNYPLCFFDNRVAGGGPGMECWVFPADEWVTYQLHFKWGKDNSDRGDNPYATFQSSDINDWPAGTDEKYRTTVELMVADEGDINYTTVTSFDQYIWFFGDRKFDHGNYEFNPPGINAIWLTQDLNDFIGSGSISVPGSESQVEFTQVIASRNPIPVPLDSSDIPAYIPTTENEIRALTGIYSPTNGNETYFDAASAQWQANPVLVFPGQGPQQFHVPKMDSFSGGIGNPADRIVYGHGGGHVASLYNGILGFDFKGTTKPTGFFLVPGSESDPNDTLALPQPDGKAPSVHSYDGMIFDQTNRRVWRIGGSPFPGGATSNDWHCPADGNSSSNPWTDNGAKPFTMFAGYAKMAYDPVSNKAFTNYQAGFSRFLNLENGNWSGTKTGHSDNFHRCSVFVPDAAGSSSGEVFALGQSNNRKATVNFNTETVSSWTTISPTGDTGWSSDQLFSLFWDELLNVVWIFGGRNDAGAGGTLTDFYRFDPATNISTQVTVTGDAPIMDNNTEANTYGLAKRFVYIPEWRAVGIMTVYNQPAYIWKLPSS